MSETQDLTNFQCVGRFHEVFGHPKPPVLQKNILADNTKLAQFRLSLIREEFNELIAAVEENNMKEVIDALADILYVVYGMGQAFGIDLDHAFKIVHASNMSKLCKNETEAIETIEYYKTLNGFHDVKVGYKLAPDNEHYVIYNMETGKILKSKYFTLPNFDEIIS
jgi:predicted HAD superfamily Cof-like phosphohydrolase